MPGANECIVRLGVLEQQFKDAGVKAVNDWAKGTIEESKSVHCPKDSGLLASTGTVTVAKNTATEYRVTLQFGGSGCNYALAVHETPKNYKGGKTWKYLTIPFERRAPLLQAKLQSEIGGLLK